MSVNIRCLLIFSNNIQIMCLGATLLSPIFLFVPSLVIQKMSAYYLYSVSAWIPVVF